jgi:hypothetical protein
MPYSAGGRLPGERASKLGHLGIIESEWVRSLVQDFEHAGGAAPEQLPSWSEIIDRGVQPLSRVWAVDGSFVTIRSEQRPPKEVSFVKTALLLIDKARLDTVDREHPHPLALKDVLTGSAVFHATVFPLKNVRSSIGSNYDAIRHIVRDSVKHDEDGAFFQTLKWIAYKKWSGSRLNSPGFECPHCQRNIDAGLPYDAEEADCPLCRKPVYLTDMLGFHLDMTEDSAPDSVASSYMLVMEHLMLFTAIRLLWSHRDRRLVSETLFIKDGPLTLRSQYSKLVPPIREFLQHAVEAGRPVHIIGQEKTGTFVDHLASIAQYVKPISRDEAPRFFVLSHDYVRKEVYRAPNLTNPYGERTNWGEKLYLKMNQGTFMVLNVPTGRYNPAGSFPSEADLIGLDRILTTIPSLVSHKFEGALFPVELANGIASMSSYPSARILRQFMDGNG